MFQRPEWQQKNQRYLTTALEWVRQTLGSARGNVRGQQLAELSATLLERNSESDPPALEILARQFGLSPFERRLLLLCAAMEFDTGIPRACAEAQGDPNRPYPTFSLAMSLLEGPAWDVVAPDRPLRYWHLIESSLNDSGPLISRALRADPRIVNFIKGLNHLDERLLPYLQEDDVPASVALPESHRQLVDRIESQIRRALLDLTSGQSFVVQLAGIDRLGKRDIARQLSQRLGVRPYTLAVGLLPNQPLEVQQLARIWRREACLMPVCLYVPELDAASDPNIRRHVQQFLEAARSLALVDVAEPGDFGETSLVCDVNKPTHKEQAILWTRALGTAAEPEAIGRLAAQFQLSQRTISKVALSAKEDTNEDVDLATRLWNGCRAVTRPKLEALTQRIDVKANWDDLVLPELQTDLLHQIAGQVRHRSIVYDDWGFREKMNRGLGITALFAGPSGTGKTMAAEVLANDLQLDLYRIDLSAVVNKYIGETEKNLRRIFDAADDGGVILFFDEADALFGKRTDVKDSHDRYANIEVNYLLQRMESYRGLAILATNIKSVLDKAFLRRLRFIVDLPLPGAKERKEIWRRAFTPNTQAESLDFDGLARLKLTGGNILNIALNAAFKTAATSGDFQLSMPIVNAAIETECHKLSMPVQCASSPFSMRD